MGKKAYMLLILMLLALSMANVIHAQNIPKPSVPISALPFITDASITATSTKLVINGIKITIINQPYAYSFNGTIYVLCYDYRYKAHSAQNWEESSYSLNNSYPPQSNTGTTVLSVQEISISPPPADEAQIDFQVEAIAGHYYQTESGTFIFPDETSGWTPIHTVTITYATPTYTITFHPFPLNDATPPPSSPSPTIPEFSGWMILPLLIVTGLLVYLKKEKIKAR